MSTFDASSICTKVSIDGCVALEHHLETIASFLPIASANHLPVRFCSTRTIFSLLISFIAQIIDLFHKDIGLYAKQ
jgi:hypothetical protein